MINRRRARRIRVITFFTIGALLIGGFVWGVFFSPLFRIRSVKIAGAEVLEPATLHAAIEEWISGKRFFIFPKAHALLYQPEALDAALRERFLRIASITLLPDIRAHILTVLVRERHAEGFWCPGERKGCFLFDGEGVLFEEIERPQGSGGLRVEDLRGKTLALGDRAVPLQWIAFMQAFSRAAAPEVWIQYYAIEQESLEANYIRAKTGEGWDILLDVGAASPDDDAAVMKTLLKEEIGERREQLEYIHLLERARGRAYYKLR